MAVARSIFIRQCKRLLPGSKGTLLRETHPSVLPAAEDRVLPGVGVVDCRAARRSPRAIPAPIACCSLRRHSAAAGDSERPCRVIMLISRMTVGWTSGRPAISRPRMRGSVLAGRTVTPTPTSTNANAVVINATSYSGAGEIPAERRPKSTRCCTPLSCASPTSGISSSSRHNTRSRRAST